MVPGAEHDPRGLLAVEDEPVHGRPVCVAVHEQRHEVNGHGPQEFRFELPADGPFSYEGTNLSMVWQVVARDPQPRRTDRTLVQPVQVLP